MICDLQKASMLKRISAFLLDAILLVILATLGGWIISVCTGYDGYMSVYSQAYERCASEYGITADLLTKAPSALTGDEIDRLNQATAALNADATVIHAYEMVTNLSVLIVTFGLMAAFLVLEFIIPLILGNGQTVGKKIFGIALMHTGGVRIRHVALFVRTILGKFAVETMPFAMAAIYVIGGLGSPVFLLVAGVLMLAEIIVLAVSHENALLHDKMAATVAVDMASQMIFDTAEQLLEYKKKAHAEKVASQPY